MLGIRRSRQAEWNSSRHRRLYFAASFSDGLARILCLHPADARPSRDSRSPAEDPPRTPRGDAPPASQAGFRPPPGPPPGPPPALPGRSGPARRPSAHSRGRPRRHLHGGSSQASARGHPPPPAPFQLRTPAQPARRAASHPPGRPPAAPHPRYTRAAPSPAPEVAQLRQPRSAGSLSLPALLGAGLQAGTSGCDGPSRPRPAPPLPATAKYGVGPPAQTLELET